MATHDEDDVTRLETPPKPASSSAPSSRSGQVTSSSGWLAGSDAIDHGRFPPGTLLGGRYRIVGRLGRGGMGEVYRADDLKLGLPAALKFLPPTVDRDPARLTQLHTEVRMARQVSHPNVCRVYDIDEVDGHTFLSMEYVDGEDVATLIKRVGRFPEQRGLEIARQICAGLAAAHQRGVVHRDLKPANVMIDGAGSVRITDFGLAGVAGEAIRAGTPAYMAPEQMAGGEVTVRSDIYALGLVLYEIFTGQRALDGRTLAELIRKREAGVVPPSSLVRDLDPEIEQAILKCLRIDPADRPASALAVAAALPGGDPLAAALAAGETPSPEMVAAAGMSEAVSIRWALGGLAWIAVALVAVMFMYERILLVNRVPLPKAAPVLEDRAREALATLGYTADQQRPASGFAVSLDYPRYIEATSSAPDRWNALATTRPGSIVFWFRTSPRLLIPIGRENNVSGTNPPLNVSGMTLVVVDGSGRLSEFHAVPEPLESDAPRTPADWSKAFEAAQLPMAAFADVKPRWVPLVFADERRAWEGRLEGQSDLLFRVEAAAYHGRLVFFTITGPWAQSARAAPPQPSRFNQVVELFAGLVMPGLMVLGAVLARRNLRLGRGDRRGAFRAASAIFAFSLVAWLLGATHVPNADVEIALVFAALGRALFDAVVLWLTYLGLEPYVRRLWPDSLIGWTRLIGGHWRDPHVGADVLLGVAAGLAMTLLFTLYTLVPPLLGWPEPMPATSNAQTFASTGYLLALIVSQIGNAISSAMLGVAGLVGFLMLLKRRWLAIGAAVVVYTPVVISGMFSPGQPLLALALGAAIISILIGVIVRFGLLAAIAALGTHFILLRAPLTTDLGSWLGSVALWHLAIIAFAAVTAFYLARQQRVLAR